MSNDNVSKLPTPKGRKNKLIDEIISKIDKEPDIAPGEPPSNINKISISGTGNIIGNNNILHIQQPTPPKRKIIVKTGDGVINATQKAHLQELIRNLVETHSQVKKSTLSWGGAWKKVLTPLKINSYHEIPSEFYDKAVKILQIEIAILKNMNSAPKKVSNWRSSQIKAIQARCNERDLQAWRKDYMQNHFDKDSMTKLTDKELQVLYRAVMGKH
ncbi:hypothetical protein [Salmonella enterica]|uniref:hypothetical protein n=1 Tax=Salmonella enterica TaxID=28901 RepID=UPI0009B18548|nr:hypothetical protein [Salmonella enterica]